MTKEISEVASRVIGSTWLGWKAVFSPEYIGGIRITRIVPVRSAVLARYVDVIADNQGTVNEGTVLENLYEYRVVPFESALSLSPITNPLETWIGA